MLFLRALEYERANNCFSPELNDLVCPSHNNDELNRLGDTGQSSLTNSKANLSSYPCSFKDGEGCANMEQVKVSPSFQGIGGNHPNENSPGGFEVNSDLAVEENKLCEGNSIETHVQVSIADMLCVACKELLFRPLVLNCGHGKLLRVFPVMCFGFIIRAYKISVTK